jgi:hypothetical protein
MATNTPSNEDITRKQPVLMVTPLSYKDIVSNISYPMPRGRGYNRGMRTRPTRRQRGRGRTPTPRLPTEALPVSSAPSEPATTPETPVADLINISDSPERTEGPRPSLQITMGTGTRELRVYSSLDDLLFS